jgi:hypothetical protein
MTWHSMYCRHLPIIVFTNIDMFNIQKWSKTSAWYGYFGTSSKMMPMWRIGTTIHWKPPNGPRSFAVETRQSQLPHTKITVDAPKSQQNSQLYSIHGWFKQNHPPKPTKSSRIGPIPRKTILATCLVNMRWTLLKVNWHTIKWSPNKILVGGFNHLEKYESQWEGWHPIYYGKIKNVPNHQPDKKVSNPLVFSVSFINSWNDHPWHWNNYIDPAKLRLEEYLALAMADSLAPILKDSLSPIVYWFNHHLGWSKPNVTRV